jgi:hypothetical protein
MQITQISIAAEQFKKGDRVVITNGARRDPAYYLGTVQRAGQHYKVLYDDGDVAEIELKYIVGRGVVKTRKAAFTKLELPKYLYATKLKPASTSTPVMPEVPVHHQTDVPTHPGSKIHVPASSVQKSGASPVAPLPTPPSPAVTNTKVKVRKSGWLPTVELEDLHSSPLANAHMKKKQEPVVLPTDFSGGTFIMPSVKKVEPMGIEEEYAKCKDYSVNKMMTYFMRIWADLNKHYFNSQLREPKIRFTRDTGAGFKTRANYWPGRNLFGFNRRLVHAPWHKFKETFLHEMCHQAVTLLDGGADIIDGKRDAHGPRWERRMRMVGLDPDKFDKTDNTEYMPEWEREKTLNDRDQIQADMESRSNISPAPGFPAAVYDPKAKKWMEGVIACRYAKKPGYWVFFTSTTADQYFIVHSDACYHINSDEAKFQTEAWTMRAGLITRAVESMR